jgi:hypothetical protein
MKLSDALQQIFPASAFPDNDLAAVFSASALKEIELPDAAMTKFNSHYMTADRAANDPEIAKTLKAKHWGHFADTIEKDIKAIVAILPDDWKTKYYAIPEGQVNGIYDRIKVVKEAVAHVSEKGSGEDVKTLSEKYRKIEKDLRDQLTAEQTEKTKLAADFASKETGIKMNYALRSKLTGMLPKLDPNLIKTDAQKNFIIDSTINSLQSDFLLEFDKENQSVINFLKKDRTDVYEGNTKVTLDKFIEKQLEPYIVKNNGGEPPVPGAAKKVEIPTGKPLTAHEIMWAKAGATV